MEIENRKRRVHRIKLTRFEHAGIRYDLRRPLVIRLEHKNGQWVCNNKTVNLWGHGKSKAAALGNLHENFAYLWREIAEEVDAVLDKKAQALKQTLLRLRAPTVV